MKRKLLILALVALSAALFFSCKVNEGTTIEDQISGFMTDVNAGSYTKLYSHFHPTETVAYSQIKAESFWNTPGMFPSGETYTLGAVVPIGTTVTTTLKSTVTYGSTGVAIIFSMSKDGEDYMIKSLTIGGSPKVQSRIP